MKGGAHHHGKRRKPQAHGAGCRDERRGLAGEGDAHVGGALYQERRWGADKKLKGFNDERVQMGRR